jgi:broad specificity phosphatase PhoE
MDLPLSKQGREEAENTARELRKTDLDVVFCSDLVRSRDTARAIAKVCGCEVIELRALRPWDLGKFTGQPVKQANSEIEEFACRKPDARVPDGESFDTFRSRLFGGLKSIVGFNAAEPALIVHNVVERVLKGWVAAGMPPTWKCDAKTLTAKGLPTSSIETLRIDPAALRAVK